MIRTIDSSKLRGTKENHLTPFKIGAWCAIYCGVALFLEWYGSGLLVFAWALAGLLVFSVFLARDRNTSLINPFSVVFAVGVVLTLCGYVSVHYLS